MTTAILTDNRYLAHDNPQHVERAARLQAINRALDQTGLRAQLQMLAAREATTAELTAVHTPAHLERVERFGTMGGGNLDPDTYVTTDSWEAALWAAGGAVRMVEAVMNGEVQNGFALIRPPGHHATPERAMGFCLINNIAVAARAAMQQFGLQRVAIVDYDVHHGNGTQDAFYRDGQVLFCSTHAFPFYPGTGALFEQGEGPGQGSTLNVPLPMGVGDQGYAQVFEQVILPALRRWQPELLLVSAGYDAHWSDPLGPMVLSATGVAQLTQMLYDCAAELCGGRLVFCLEGGYNLPALAASVMACLQVLLGNGVPTDDPIGTISAPEPDLTQLLTRIASGHPLLRDT